MDGILLIDKPLGVTSFDVCREIKRRFKTGKVGHSGTLDPQASGLLLVAINKATKAINFLPGNKTYLANVRFGIETDTLDLEGKVINEAKIIMPTREKLQEALDSFIGESEQKPPMYSAVKINGKKLYEYARNNEQVEVKSRKINIFSIKLVDIFEDGFSYEAHVSKGTYIRTLSLDIAKKLNNIATTTMIRRTKIGSLKVEDAGTIQEAELININDCIELPVHIVEDENIVIHGKKIKCDLKDELIKVLNKDKKLLAVYEKSGDEYKPKRGLF